MKNKASAFFIKVRCLLSSIAKAKSMAIKNKTSAAKARLIMFSSMRSKVLVGSISDKIHGLLGHTDHKQSDDMDNSKAIVPYINAMVTEPHSTQDDDDEYPDLRHCLFDEDDTAGGSIIDLVRNSKEEGEDFNLEQEIDHVADLFIKRFHKQMRLQKLESFKRFQQMLARSV